MDRRLRHRSLTVLSVRPTDSELAGVWIAKAELTDTIPTSTTAQQWGTEEARIPQDVLPVTVNVSARVTGRVRLFTTTATRRGSAKVELSVDGGATWVDGWTSTDDPMVTQSTMGATGRVPISDQCASLSATVTGDVLARVQCWDVTTAGDCWFEGGRLILAVHEI